MVIFILIKVFFVHLVVDFFLAMPVADSEVRVDQGSICDILHHHAVWCLICSINNA